MEQCKVTLCVFSQVNISLRLTKNEARQSKQAMLYYGMWSTINGDVLILCKYM